MSHINNFSTTHCTIKERSDKSAANPNKLTTKQPDDINTHLQENSRTYGFKIWDGAALSKLIMDKYGVECSVRNSQWVFHKLGFSHIRPYSGGV